MKGQEERLLEHRKGKGSFFEEKSRRERQEEEGKSCGVAKARVQHLERTYDEKMRLEAEVRTLQAPGKGIPTCFRGQELLGSAQTFHHSSHSLLTRDLLSSFRSESQQDQEGETHFRKLFETRELRQRVQLRWVLHMLEQEFQVAIFALRPDFSVEWSAVQFLLQLQSTTLIRRMAAL